MGRCQVDMGKALSLQPTMVQMKETGTAGRELNLHMANQSSIPGIPVQSWE